MATGMGTARFLVILTAIPDHMTAEQAKHELAASISFGRPEIHILPEWEVLTPEHAGEVIEIKPETISRKVNGEGNEA